MLPERRVGKEIGIIFQRNEIEFDFLPQPAIARLGLLVHYLDVGGVQPPEAAGIESVLAGLRETLTQDDQLLTAASAIFDGLLASFDKGVPST